MHSQLLSSLVARAARLPRRRLVLGLALPLALIAAALIGVLVYAAPPASVGPAGRTTAAAAPAAGDAEAGTALPPPSGLLVEVTGAVAHPGVYRVAKGERASAAVAAAGGVTAAADPNRLPNMAARLKDGQLVNVPFLGTSTRSAGTGTTRVAHVSLNTATADELATVPGFTPDLAAAVIRYRTEFGGFATTRELVDVLEMSEADYLQAKKYVTV